MIFKDYFSNDSEGYLQFRPEYPPELFSFLAAISNHHEKAWDCATGTGQSAVGLADYFSEIIATDASQTQIKHARKKMGVTYQVASAENSGIESNSIDLITVAQAFHWFNIDAFSKEANRVLKADGIMAIWTYNLLSVQKEIDEIINDLYYSILGEFWPAERKMVENNYRNIRLPFAEIDAPEFSLTAEWNLAQLLGYLHTWSAVKSYQKEFGTNPVKNIQGEISGNWGQADKTYSVTWPLSIRLWHKNGFKRLS